MSAAATPERKRRRPPKDSRAATPITWKAGGKMREIGRWARSVMADRELPPSAKEAAWALSFAFGTDGMAWEKRATTAGRFGLKISTFKESIAWLERRGHLVTEMGRVPNYKKLVQITRPSIPEGTVAPYPDEFQGTVGPDSEGTVGPDSCILLNPLLIPPPEESPENLSANESPRVCDVCRVSKFSRRVSQSGFIWAVCDSCEPPPADTSPQKRNSKDAPCACGAAASHRDRNTGAVMCEECAFDDFKADPVPLHAEIP